MTEGVELQNQDKARTLGEKEIYKDLRILEADTIKHAEIKEKNLKEYIRRTRKLHCRNMIKEVNACGVPLVRYTEPFLKWEKEEFQEMDKRTRKLMKMLKALHPRDDVDKLYVSRKRKKTRQHSR